MHTFNLFISHSWKHDSLYQGLKSLLQNRGYFEFKDYSVPESRQIENARTDHELEQRIENKIRSCSVVLILANVASTSSKWINKEIKIAKRLGKPIIGIKAHHSKANSQVVVDAADAVCQWRADDIVEQIRKLRNKGK